MDTLYNCLCRYLSKHILCYRVTVDEFAILYYTSVFSSLFMLSLIHRIHTKSYGEYLALKCGYGLTNMCAGRHLEEALTAACLMRGSVSQVSYVVSYIGLRTG